MCNEQVGHVECILSESLNSKYKTKIKKGKWISAAGGLHSVNNFLHAGSEDTGELVSASVVGCWPLTTLSRASVGVEAFNEYFEYISKIFISNDSPSNSSSNFKIITRLNTKTEEEFFQEENRRSSLINVIAKGCGLIKLRYRDSVSSFMLSRLYPSAQQIVRLFSRLRDLEDLSDVLNQFDDTTNNLWEQFERLIWSNLKSNSTQADTVLISGINTLDFINEMNQFIFSNNGSKFKEALENEYQKYKTTHLTSIQERFKQFTQFLRYVLSDSNHHLKKLINQYIDKYPLPEPIIERPFRPLTNANINNILEYISKSKILEEKGISIRDQLNEINSRMIILVRHCITIALSKINIDLPCTFAVVGLGSWGKKTPLPNNTGKFLIVTKEPLNNELNNQLYFEKLKNLFIEQLLDVGFPTGMEVSCGESIELFVEMIKNENQNSSITEDNLLKLCSVWDATYLCGDSSLANLFRSTVSAILQSKDEVNIQPRSQQFVQSFFLYLKKEMELYENNLSENPTELDIRLLTINLSKICNLISIYYDVTAVDTWSRIESFQRCGLLSSSACDQLLCACNISTKILIQGQLIYKGSNCIAYAPGTNNDQNDKLVVDNQLEWNILVYSIYNLVPNFGSTLHQFSIWLEGYSSELNPLLEHSSASLEMVIYYHTIAKSYSEGKKLDWPTVFNLCDRAIMHLPQKNEDNDNNLIFYKEKEELFELFNTSKIKKEMETNISTSCMTLVQNLASQFPEGLSRSLTTPLQMSIEQYESIPENLLTRITDQFIRRNLTINDIPSSTHIGIIRLFHEKINNIFKKWKTQKETYEHSTKFLIQIHNMLVLCCVWVDHKKILPMFQNFMLQLLQLPGQKIVRDCLSFCFLDWEKVIIEVLNEKPNQILSVLTSMPCNTAGHRYSTIVEQEEIESLLNSITISQNQSNVRIQYVSPCIGIDSFPNINNNNDKSSPKIIEKYLHNDIINQLFINNNTYLHIDTNHPQKLQRDDDVFMIPIEKDRKTICYFTFFPEFPAMQLAIDEFTRRFSGCSPSSVLVRMEIISKIKGKSSSILPVLITKNISGTRLSVPLKNNVDQFQLIEQRTDPTYFTLKIFETLLLLPHNDGPENLIAQPVTGINGKSAFRLVSLDTGTAFVKPILEGDGGQEIVNVRSILFCFRQMEKVFNQEAVQQFLALDPYDFLLDWLSSLEKLENLYISTNNNNNGIFKLSELKIQRPPETQQFDSVKLQTSVFFELRSLTISSLYHRFVRIQELVKNDYKLAVPRMKHSDLLLTLEPKLAVYYSEAKSLLSTTLAWSSLPKKFHKSVFEKRIKKSKLAYSTRKYNELNHSLNTEHRCKERIEQIKKIHVMVSELSKRKELLTAGKLEDALEGIFK